MIEEKIEKYHLMILKLAQKYKKPPVVEVDDLYSLGVQTLIKALGTFDESRGVKESTFIWRAMSNAMIGYRTKNSCATTMNFCAFKKHGPSPYVRIGDNISMIDGKYEDSPLDKIIKKEEMLILKKVIKKLSDIEKFIVENSRKFLGELNASELGEQLNISTARVYQMHSKVRRRLNKLTNYELVMDFRKC